MTITADPTTADVTVLTPAETNDLKSAWAHILGSEPDLQDVWDLITAPAFQAVVARHAHEQVQAAQADATAAEEALHTALSDLQDARMILAERTGNGEVLPELPDTDAVTRDDTGTVTVVVGAQTDRYLDKDHALAGLAAAHAAYDDFVQQEVEAAARAKARQELFAQVLAATQQAGRTPNEAAINAYLDALDAQDREARKAAGGA